MKNLFKKKWLMMFFLTSITLVLCFLIISIYSEKISFYKCSGEITEDEDNLNYQSDLYLKLSEYRWWVGLWSDSDGYVKIEVPGNTWDYFNKIEKNSEHMSIYYNNELRGYFSRISHFLNIKSNYYFFEGQCLKIND